MNEASLTLAVTRGAFRLLMMAVAVGTAGATVFGVKELVDEPVLANLFRPALYLGITAFAARYGFGSLHLSATAGRLDVSFAVLRVPVRRRSFELAACERIECYTKKLDVDSIAILLALVETGGRFTDISGDIGDLAAGQEMAETADRWLKARRSLR